MRSLAPRRTSRAKLAVLTGALILAALAAPNGAWAHFCAWDGVASPSPPDNLPANMIALPGGICTETASNVSFFAQESAPGAPGQPLNTIVPYTGFAFFAYDGGFIFDGRSYNAITVQGQNISITSYPADSSTYPGAVTAPYGVFALGRSFIENSWLPSAITFAGSTSVTTTSDAAYGLYAKAGGMISSTAPMTVTTSGLGASGVVASSAALVTPPSGDCPGVTVPAAPASVTLSGGGLVTTNGDNAAGLRATGSGAQISASGLEIATNGAGSFGAQADRSGVIVLSGGSVTTAGAGSIGVAALSAGSASLNALSVTTALEDAHGIAAAGSGSQISLSGANAVVTEGAGAIGLYASAGGAISATGTTSVTTSGGLSPNTGLGAYGVFSVGAPSTATFAGSTSVTTANDAAFGLYARAGGTISSTAPMTVTTGGLGASGVVADAAALVIPTHAAAPVTAPAAPASVTLSGGGSVTTNGANAPGLYATGASSSITTSNSSGAGPVQASTSGADSPGAKADSGAALFLSGGSIAAAGVGSSGVLISGSGTTASLSDVAVKTTGGYDAANSAFAPALLVTDGALMTVSNGSLSTSGASAAGVSVDTGGVVKLNGTTINVTGDGSAGLAVRGASSEIDATSVAVKTTGVGAYGVNADGAGSQAKLAAATITTSGAGAFGLLASDAAATGSAGSITASGTLKITTTNPAAAAVGLQGDGASIVATGGGNIASAGRSIAFTGGTNQVATFDNFTIANQTGDLIFADPSDATVNFNSTTANAGSNNLLNATGGSMVTLNANASTLTGQIQTDSASTSTVNLSNGSSWTMTGSSVISNFAIANSVVVFAPPASGTAFKTLTLVNYVGSNASATMNASLGGAGSESDQIVINGGKATGSTVVTVNNVNGLGGQTTGNGIPLIVAINGGTIASNAFVLANAPIVGGYRYTLKQTAQGDYLVSSPASPTPPAPPTPPSPPSPPSPPTPPPATPVTPSLTPADIAQGSVTNVAKAQQRQIITGRVLGSILLGATEQVNCSNCSSGFGSIGSYALGAHGRVSLTPEVTAMGGFSYDEYTAQGITVTNAPTFAGSLIYDPINFGRSRPFFEVGGGLVPFERVSTTRTYPNGALNAEGVGNGIDRSLGLFGRVGWVDRVTPIDEAAIYTDISRSWLRAGGYTEGLSGANPFPATVSTGLVTLDVLRLGAQYTHLFGGQFEANVSGAVAYGFNSGDSSQWAIAGAGTIAPYPIGNSVWYEWGARVGYRFSQRMVLDAFAIGTLGGQVGTTFHGGLALRYLF